MVGTGRTEELDHAIAWLEKLKSETASPTRYFQRYSPSNEYEFVDWFTTQCRMLGINEIPVCLLRSAMESRGIEVPARPGALLSNCGFKSRMYKDQRWYDISKMVTPSLVEAATRD